jgi:hypothetical protein
MPGFDSIRSDSYGGGSGGNKPLPGVTEAQQTILGCIFEQGLTHANRASKLLLFPTLKPAATAIYNRVSSGNAYTVDPAAAALYGTNGSSWYALANDILN